MEDKKIIGKRFNVFRKAISKTLVDISKETGISHSNIARIERGEIFPNFTILAYLHTKYLLNFNWLVTGDGNMFNNHSNENTIENLKEIFPDIQIDNTFIEVINALLDPVLSNAIRHKFAFALEIAKNEIPHLFEKATKGDNVNKKVMVGGK